jgi:hypothetical protein
VSFVPLLKKKIGLSEIPERERWIQADEEVVYVSVDVGQSAIWCRDFHPGRRQQ